VAVVIATYDRADVLPRALLSVLRQTYRGWTCYVVGDGCRDGTTALMAEVVRRYPGRFVYENLPTNLGRLYNSTGAAAKDRAIGISREPLIAYLDDDNAWFPDHLHTLLGAFRRRGRAPRVGLAWSDMYVAPAAGDGVGSRHGSFGPPALGSIDSSEMMTTRAALSAAGGWTRGLPSRDPAWRDLRCDDYLLARRIVEAGFEWVHVPRVTVQYWARDAVPEEPFLDDWPRPLPRRVPSLAEFPEAP
jgi:glycosyltransferase involved in cell wall biosynthesis